MPTNRTRISRPSLTANVSARAVEVFAAMRDLACDCPPRDWGGAYWKHQLCAGCREYDRLGSELHAELRLRPWQPAVESPNAENPYPPGSYAGERWQPDREAQARWLALNAILAARRRAAP
jgi:hypothetical protein